MVRKSKPFDDSCSSKWNVMEIDEFYQKDLPIEQLRKAIPHRAITKSILTQNLGKCSKLFNAIDGQEPSVVVCHFHHSFSIQSHDIMKFIHL